MATASLYEAQAVSEWLSGLLGVQPDPSAHITDLELQAAERELGVRLPPSYREFLRAFGASVWPRSGLFGLPRDDWRRDLVLQNKSGQYNLLPDFLKFMDGQDGPPFYFATCLAQPDGECPVVRWDEEKGICVVADSFVLFLEMLGCERLCRSRMVQATW
jgi:SMI1 / KNR4 family (SUKH-1)